MSNLTHRQYKPTMIILFVIAIAFTAAMIGTTAAYWKQRVDTCHDTNLGDCKQRTRDYLFDGYRNITNKFFVDCFMVFFNIVSFIAVGLAYQKVPRSVKYVLVTIIFALSIWSLACGIKSIDEEDKEDAKVRAKQEAGIISLDDAKVKLAAAKTKLADTQTLKTTTEAKKTKASSDLVLVNAWLAGHPNTDPAYSTYQTNKTQLETGIAQATAGLVQINAGIAQLTTGIADAEIKISDGQDSIDSLERLKEKYHNYRKSVMALVLINFVAIYAITFISSFLTPLAEHQVEVAKLDQIVTTNGIEHVALKKAPSSQVEMNAQNAM